LGVPVKALVTGDAGFVGRHLRDALVDRGWVVDGMDITRGAEQDCRRLFVQMVAPHYDLVIHAAAVIGGRATIDGDPLATAENLELDSLLFRWAARTRPGRVVYLSSSSVYPVHLQTGAARRERPGGQLDERLIDPDRWREPFGPPDQTYGWSKLVGEHLAGQLRRYGVPVSVVRPFSGYGPDQDTSYPFPAFLERARGREDPFPVWGDGEQVRDFIHVDDVTAAILACVDAGVDGPVNLCTGRGTSFRELAELLCAAVGYQPTLAWRLGAPVGVRWRVGNPTRMHAVYRPRIPLEEGIRRAVADG
jgi:nucleoside-diphosphate-sugar epimerase